VAVLVRFSRQAYYGDGFVLCKDFFNVVVAQLYSDLLDQKVIWNCVFINWILL
jgi:hypothetical protein